MTRNKGRNTGCRWSRKKGGKRREEMERYGARGARWIVEASWKAVIQREPRVAGPRHRNTLALFPIPLSLSPYFSRCIRKLTSILPGFTLHAVLRADIPVDGNREPARRAPFSYRARNRASREELDYADFISSFYFSIRPASW